MDEEGRVAARGEGLLGLQAGVHRYGRILKEMKCNVVNVNKVLGLVVLALPPRSGAGPGPVDYSGGQFYTTCDFFVLGENFGMLWPSGHHL